MKSKLTPAEIKELLPLARAAVDTETSPWIQLGQYFKAKRETAAKSVVPRPTRESD